MLIVTTALLAILWSGLGLASGVAVDFEALVPGNTATGITASKLTGSGIWANQQASAALVSVESNSINFCIDGSSPTASAGTNLCHRLDAGQSLMVQGPQNVRNFLCIDRVSGSTATVKITIYFGGE